MMNGDRLTARVSDQTVEDLPFSFLFSFFFFCFVHEKVGDFRWKSYDTGI